MVKKKPEWSWGRYKENMREIFTGGMSHSNYSWTDFILSLFFTSGMLLAYVLFHPALYALQWLIYLLSPSSKENNEEQK